MSRDNRALHLDFRFFHHKKPRRSKSITATVIRTMIAMMPPLNPLREVSVSFWFAVVGVCDEGEGNMALDPGV